VLFDLCAEDTVEVSDVFTYLGELSAGLYQMNFCFDILTFLWVLPTVFLIENLNT
jgi:hypothetical protein